MTKLRSRPLSALTLIVLLAISGCASAPPAPAPVAPPPMVAVKPSQVIPIAQIERGVLIVMPVEKVSFDFGKATLSAPEAHEFLDRVAALLRDKTQARIILEGHTDNQGARALNQKLSEDRAETVRVELGRRKVTESRISTAGFAFDRPVAANDGEAGRKENRRVELIVLGETVDNITRGEPPGSFEVAFGQLKAAIESGALRAPKGN